MVTMVNGYMCYTSCQAAAARAGKDPHAPLGAPPGEHGDKDKADGLAGNQPPSILDPGPGTDKKSVNGVDDPNAIDPTKAAGAANGDYQASQGINLLV